MEGEKKKRRGQKRKDYSFTLSDIDEVKARTLAGFTDSDRKRADKLRKELLAIDSIEISVCIECEPESSDRPRFRPMFKGGKYAGTKTYKEPNLERWQDGVRDILTAALPHDFTAPEGMVMIRSLRIYKAPPKSASRARLLLMEEGVIRPEKRPDIDNYEKCIFDALSSVFWKDDGQVVSNHADMFYSSVQRIEIDLECWLDRRDLP
jgi:Holliday junction resolvase RusA-like endonuclease